jgi:hypothetical protein
MSLELMNFAIPVEDVAAVTPANDNDERDPRFADDPQDDRIPVGWR